MREAKSSFSASAAPDCPCPCLCHCCSCLCCCWWCACQSADNQMTIPAMIIRLIAANLTRQSNAMARECKRKKRKRERERQRKWKKRRGEECKVDNNLATLAYPPTLPNSPALSELIVCANWLMSDWCWTDCCAVQLKLKAKEGFKNAKLFKCWLNEVKYLVVWSMCNVCVMYA